MDTRMTSPAQRLRPRAPFPLVIAALALGLTGCSRGPAGPHVLLVTVDTLRADRVGAYGYTRETTPHLDALAREGVLFERSYTHAPFTAPSHASLLTGLHPQSHGVLYWGQAMDPAAATLQDLLGRRGYRTGAFHNHPGLVPTEITRGFDEVQVRYYEPWQATVEAYFAWLDGGRGKTGAAWVHLWDAHRPYGFRDWRADFVRPHVDRPDDQLTLAYAESGFGPAHDVRVGRTEAFYNLHPGQRTQPIPVGGEARLLDERDWTYIADRYDASVRYADQGVGALVEGLRERGLLDDTLLIVTSDHGEALSEREASWFTHDPFLYDEVMRVPLVMRLPEGAHPGRRLGVLARGIDVLPTILEVVDMAPPRGIQGTSLVPWIEGRAAGGPRYLFGQTQSRNAKESSRRVPPGEHGWLEYRQVLTDGRHKLIHDLEFNRFEFYDLEADPGERSNLWADGAHDPPEAARELARQLHAHRETLPVAGQLEREMSAEQKALLRSMGYLSAEDEAPEPEREARR
jgi:arylsulfatase A-like enzyme